MREFDYIIVGGGSAGCVLAEKLTACGRHQVLLLEAGPSDRRFWVQVPIGYGILFHQKAVNWMYNTDPVPGLDGRVIYHPRGKVLGGSGSINALVYHRGQAGDYDDWAAAGNDGWSYADVAPHFEQLETPPQDDPGAASVGHRQQRRFSSHGKRLSGDLPPGPVAVCDAPAREGTGSRPI